MEELKIIRFHNDEIPVFDGLFAVNIVPQTIGLNAYSAVGSLKTNEILGPDCVYTQQLHNVAH